MLTTSTKQVATSVQLVVVLIPDSFRGMAARSNSMGDIISRFL